MGRPHSAEEEPIAPPVTSASAGRALVARSDTPRTWDTIVRTHDHRVVVLLLGMGIRIDRAKELAQTTWMRLLEQHRAGKLKELDFPGLALAQARFLALDERRRAKAELVRLEPLGDEDTLRDAGPSAELRLVSREELERAVTTLAECTPSAQKVFRLVYEEPSLSHAVVAERVGLSVQRVRQILCEVRRKLKDALAEEGPSEDTR